MIRRPPRSPPSPYTPLSRSALTITATPAESDPDAITTVTITGVPATASLNHGRSEDHTSELQSPDHLLFRLLLQATDDDLASIHLSVTASTSDNGSVAATSV